MHRQVYLMPFQQQKGTRFEWANKGEINKSTQYQIWAYHKVQTKVEFFSEEYMTLVVKNLYPKAHCNRNVFPFIQECYPCFFLVRINDYSHANELTIHCILCFIFVYKVRSAFGMVSNSFCWHSAPNIQGYSKFLPGLRSATVKKLTRIQQVRIFEGIQNQFKFSQFSSRVQQ